jgi:uncharacterized membrane protein YhaH (DUF805 family)
VAQIVVTIALFAIGLTEDMIILAGTLVAVLPPIVILGVIAGQPFENRFGPAPGQRALKDIFG